MYSLNVLCETGKASTFPLTKPLQHITWEIRITFSLIWITWLSLLLSLFNILRGKQNYVFLDYVTDSIIKSFPHTVWKIGITVSLLCRITWLPSY